MAEGVRFLGAAVPGLRDAAERQALLRTLLRFGLGGGGATAFYLVAAFGFNRLLPGQELFAHLTAYAAGIAISYLIHCRFTFRYTGRHSVAVPRFLITAAAAFLLSTFAVHIAATHLHIAPMLTLVGAGAIIVAVNFLAMFFWVFGSSSA